MRFTELICLVAAERFRSTAQIGVRLSPVTLTTAEAIELAALARDRLGEPCFISIAAPGVPERDEERLCLSSGERAAERATAWRNRVDSERGERVLYVSVDRQGRAGGLTDTLEAITELTLTAALKQWLQEHPSALPPALAEALAQTPLLGRQPARAVCAFTEAVAAAAPSDRWTRAGRELPLIGLARDAGLRDDPRARLESNFKLVRGAATGEARRQRRLSAEAKAAHAQLREVITRHGAVGDLGGGLSSVDLGDIETSELSTRPRKTRAKARRKKRQKTRKTAPPKRERPETSTSPGAAPGTPSGLQRSESAATRQVQEEQAKQALATSDAEAAESGPEEFWTEAMQRREFGSSSAALPPGLCAVLLHSLEQPLSTTTLTVRRGPLITWLDRSARKLPAPEFTSLDPGDVHDAGLRDLLDQLVRARAAIVEPLLAAQRSALVLARLVKAPLLALSSPDFREAAEDYLHAADAALRRSLQLGQAQVARGLLDSDTVHLADESGEEVLLILGPLHPLWLGQVLHRHRDATARDGLSPVAKRLVVRGLSARLASPQQWLGPAGGTLERAPDVAGLISFGVRTAVASDPALRDVGAALVAQLIDLAPHARVTARVLIDGPHSRPLAEGILAGAEQAASEQEAPLSCLELHRSGELLESAAESVRLRQLPAPVDARAQERCRPHLAVLLREPPKTEDTAGAKTSLHGVVGAEPAVRLNALMLGEPVTPSVPAEAPEVDLCAELQASSLLDAAWYAVVAPRISRAVPRGMALVLHEEVGDAQVALVGRDLRAVSSHLRPVYQRLGVADIRPSVLQRVTRRLAQLSPRGVLSFAQGSDALLAGQLLLGALSTEVGPDGALAPLVGHAHETFTGAQQGAADPAGALALGLTVRSGALIVIAGYCSLRAPLDHEVSGAVLGGRLGQRLLRVGQTALLLGERRALGGDLARAVVSDLFADLTDAHPVRRLLDALAVPEVRVKGLILAPASSDLGQTAGPLRLRGVGEVDIRVLDETQIERVVRG